MVWNQWETGEGTGGGRVAAMTSEEHRGRLKYDRGIDPESMDQDDGIDEKSDDTKTFTEKRAAKTKKPGIHPNSPVRQSWFSLL